MFIAVNFHYVRENYEFPFKAIFGHTPESFRRQLLELSRHGKFISHQDVMDAINENKSLNRSILITFDDGLKEQFEVAKPILDELGIPAIFFVNPSNQEKKIVSTVHQIHLLRSYKSGQEILNLIKEVTNNNIFRLNKEEEQMAENHYNYDFPEDAHLKYLLNFKFNPQFQKKIIDQCFKEFFKDSEKIARSLYMSNEQLCVLAENGQLGSHTYHHFPIGLLEENEAKAEIENSSIYLTKLTGISPKAISYPYGSYDACKGKIADLSSQNGFRFGFTMERAGNHSINENSLRFARFDCNDVPGGKYNLYNGQNLFEDIMDRQWKF